MNRHCSNILGFALALVIGMTVNSLFSGKAYAQMSCSAPYTLACVPAPCADSSDASRNVSDIPPTTNGNNSTGTCGTGYTASTPGPLYSCSLGVFTYVSGSCVAASCSQVTSGSLITTYHLTNISAANSGSDGTGTCASGYTASLPAPQFLCNNGTFSYASGSCAANCAAVSASSCSGEALCTSHAVKSIAPANSGGTATGTCNSGDTGSVTYNCNNGTLTYASGSCCYSGSVKYNCPSSTNCKSFFTGSQPCSGSTSASVCYEYQNDNCSATCYGAATVYYACPLTEAPTGTALYLCPNLSTSYVSGGMPCSGQLTTTPGASCSYTKSVSCCGGSGCCDTALCYQTEFTTCSSTQATTAQIQAKIPDYCG